MENKKDYKKFKDLIKTLADVFNKGQVPEPTTVEIYFNVLKDLQIDQVEAAVIGLLKDRVYTGFPLPAHIRGKVRVQGKPTAVEGWAKVMKCLEGGPIPIDPVITKTVANLGGYEKLGLTSYDQLVWVGKDFERLYDTLDERRDIHELPEPGEKKGVKHRDMNELNEMRGME